MHWCRCYFLNTYCVSQFTFVSKFLLRLNQNLLINTTLITWNLSHFIFSLWAGMPCQEGEIWRDSVDSSFLGCFKACASVYQIMVSQATYSSLSCSFYYFFPTMKYNFIVIYMLFSEEHLNTCKRSLTKLVK